LGLLALNRFEDFAAMDGNLSRGCHSNPNLVPLDLDDGDHDFAVDDETLIFFPRQNLTSP